MEKYSYAEWQKLSKQLTETKDNVEELSKLYIVVHEKVRTILRKSYIDFSESLKSTKGKNSLIPVPSLHIFNRNTFLGS